MVRWLNIEITFAHFLVSFFSTKNLEIIQLKILLFQLDGSLSSRWSRGWEIDRTAGCFHRSAHQTQRENCLGSRSPRRLSPSKLCSLKGENPKHVNVSIKFLPKGLVPSRQRSGRDARRGGVLPCHVSCHVMLPCCHVMLPCCHVSSSLSVSI